MAISSGRKNRTAAAGEKLTFRECVIADRSFYARTASLVVPMILQNTLSNVVSLLDNVMVGQVGTLPMSAVAIINQMLFVFYLCIWGSIAGAGIYGTQFYGKGDTEGVRVTLRMKFLIAFAITAIAVSILYFGGLQIGSLYVAADTPAADRAQIMQLAGQYLHIMLIGLVPFFITQCYAGTLRETGNAALPMIASITAMIVNFIFNALLIFGLFGFPKMGVAGAAVATVISRFVELLVVVIPATVKKEKYDFLTGLFRHFRIPRELVWPILSKSLPLLLNELLWSTGQATLLQCYSVRGIGVVAAMNIANTISQIFNEVALSMGNAASIMVGHELGADRLVNAKRTAWRLASLGIVSCVAAGGILFAFAPYIPRIYRTEEEIRLLATQLIRVIAVMMPAGAFLNVTYFTLRSGGKTLITFLFDSCFSWTVSVVWAFVLTRFTTLPILPVFMIINALELIKCVIGYLMLRSGIWVVNMVK